MNQRERILTVAIVALVVIVGGQMIYSRVTRGFAMKEGKIETLEKEIKVKKRTVKDGLFASDSINKLVPSSLPSKTENALNDYRTWLGELEQEVGFEDQDWKHMTSIPEKEVFDLHKFSLSGIGNLQQLIKLIYRFHEKDYLHRIDLIKLEQTRDDPYQMKIALTVSALALKRANPDQSAPPTLSNRLTKSIEDYESTIVERNIFAGPNFKPKLNAVAKTSVPRDGNLNHEIGATDTEGQKLSYSLLGEAPRGVKLDSKSGKLVGVIKDLGKYDLMVRAKDNGVPSRYSDQKLTIEVVEPPPPPAPKVEPPKFDVASQAYVSALVAGREGPQVWVKNRLENKTMYLKIGDELKLGDIKGKVVAIGANYMEVESDGKKWIAGQDESLADAFKRGTVN